MTAELGFCPFCGTRIATADQAFCAACGKQLLRPGAPEPALPAPPAAVASASVSPFTDPANPVAGPWTQAPAPPISSLAPAWSGVGSWGSLAQILGVALPVLVAWIAVTLVVVVPLSDAVRGSSGALSSGVGVGGIGTESLLSLLAFGTGVVGSMLAGLNFQVSATSGVGSGSGTVGLAPLLTLSLFAVIAFMRTRQFARQTASATVGAFLRPAVTAAAVTAVLLYAGALILTSGIGGAVDSVSGSSGYTPVVHGGPSLGAMLFVLFPVLLAANALGALRGGGWPHFLAWLSARTPSPRREQALALLPFVGYAAAGYVAAVVVSSVVGLVVLLVAAVINGADVVTLLRAVPAAAVMMPNFAALFVLAGTGTSIGVTYAGSGLSQAATGSLWNAPLEWVLSGVVVLLLPGLLAGVIARSRTLSATPGMMALTGGITALIALVVAVIAVPTVALDAGALYGSGSGSAKFVFDFGQAFIIGGLAVVGTTLVGYRYGDGAAAAIAGRVPRGPESG